MSQSSRREFLKQSAAFALATGLGAWTAQSARAAAASAGAIQFGMVTYQWGRDWDVPTLIKNLSAAKVLGVELRTTHAHKVEPTLSADERKEVKKRFEDSPVKLVSIGSAEDFHNPDPAKLAKNIENTKAFIKLSADVGSSGVKVRPNDLPKNVPQEKTIEQIGKSLNLLGAFAADYNQQIRLEIHGGCARIPIIKKVIDVATHKNVTLCWNSNNVDQEAPGLEANFNSVKDRLGHITHVRELNTPGYDWQLLAKLFVKAGYKGWWLLEAGSKDPADRVAAIAKQRELFEQLMANAKA